MYSALPLDPEYPDQNFSNDTLPSGDFQNETGSLNEKLVSNSDDVDGAVAGVGTEPPRGQYPWITIPSFLKRLLWVFIVNIALKGSFIGFLKHYCKKGILMSDDRRWFNMGTLFIAAALSMGISYLLDHIGFMSRGLMFGKIDNTKDEVRIEFLVCALQLCNARKGEIK